MNTATRFYSTRALREVDNVALYRQKLDQSVPSRRRMRIVRCILTVTVASFLALVLYQLMSKTSAFRWDGVRSAFTETGEPGGR
jgi:hypothetical protein